MGVDDSLKDLLPGVSGDVVRHSELSELESDTLLTGVPHRVGLLCDLGLSSMLAGHVPECRSGCEQ